MPRKHSEPRSQKKPSVPFSVRLSKNIRRIMGTDCKPEDLLPLVLLVSAISIFASLLRILTESFRYNTAVNDPSSSTLEKWSHIFFLCTCVFCAVGLSSFSIYLYKVQKCQVEHRVAIFLQVVVLTCISTFVEGGLGTGSNIGSIAIPCLGVLMDVPVIVNMVVVALNTIVFAVVTLGRFYGGNIAWFERPQVPEFQVASFLWSSLVPLVVCYTFVSALRREQQRHSEEEKRTVEILALLSAMKTDEVHDVVEKERELGRPKNELIEAISDLEEKLSTYKPFIPFGLINPKAYDWDEGEEDSDEEESEEASDDDSFHNQSMTSIQGGGAEMSGRSGRKKQDDKYGFGGEANVLKKRLSTIIHIHYSNLPSTQDVRDKLKKIDVSEFVVTVLRKSERFKGIPVSVTPNSIMLSWNTHNYSAFHAREACFCALEIGSELQQLKDQLDWCIVVASGMNFFGTVGDNTMRQPFVCGEHVDLAMRLAPLALQRLGCRILITNEVNKLCSGSVTAVPIDVVAPAWPNQQGRATEVTLFDLRAKAGKEKEDQQITFFRNAFKHLRNGDIDSAHQHFGQYCDRQPGDVQAQRLFKIILSGRTPYPYVRRELQWEMFEDNEVRLQPVNVVTTQQEDENDNSRPAEKQEHMDLKNVVSKFEKEKKEEVKVETGFFDMFVAEEPEEEEEVQAEALNTAVPRDFEDGAGDRWKRGELSIGEGAFSNVYLALSKNGVLVAIKCFSMVTKLSSLEELQQEVLTLAKLRHENVVGYVSCAGTANHFIILMEYVSGGSLAKMLSQFHPLPLAAVKSYMDDILKGLAYLHHEGITHCDMKPHNVLLSGEGTCKLSDFGSAITKVQRQQEQEDGKGGAEGTEGGNGANDGGKEGAGAGGDGTSGTGGGNIVDAEDPQVKGTSWYMAPEAARGDIMPSNDIWSLGITLLEMLNGKEPWGWRGKEAEFIAALGKDELDMKPEIPYWTPSDAKDFLSLCFIRDPAERATASELLKHPFIES